MTIDSYDDVQNMIQSRWRARALLVSMVLLQALSLSVRWLLMAEPDWTQLAFLLLFTIGAGAVVLWLPHNLMSVLRRAREVLVRREHLLILVLVLFVLVVGVVNANVQRVTTDEALSYQAATVLAEEGVGSFLTHYGEMLWLADRHPPLAPLLYGLAVGFLGPHLIVMRLICVALSAGTVIGTYFLGKELYDSNTGLVAAFLLTSFPLFPRLGVLANNDQLVIFFFTLGLLLSLRLARAPSYRLALLVGLVIGAGLLSKYTMVLIYPILCAFYLLNSSFRRIKPHLVLIVLLSAALPAAWLVYAAQAGILAMQARLIVGYTGLALSPTSEWGLAGVGRMKYRIREMLTDVPNGLGPYNLLIMAMGAWYLLRRRSPQDLLILAWTVLVFLPVMIMLPDARYFFLAAPALALAMAVALQRVPEIQEQAVVMSLIYCGQVLYLYVVVTQGVHLPIQ